jgi:Zn-dependent protease with chaperone function
VIGLFVGGLLGAGVTSQTGSLQAVGGAVGVIGVVGTALLGAGSFFAAVYIAELITHPSTIVGSLLGGAILAILFVAVIAHFEGDLLRLRGYRRPTRDEVRTIAPHVQAVGSAMKLSTFPRFVISDTANPGAWTHMRHIVITTGMIEMLEPDQLRAVIAHEMNHWRTGDVVALRFVWSCGWPIALMYNLGTMLSGTRPGDPQSGKVPRTILGLIGWAILRPAWIHHQAGDRSGSGSQVPSRGVRGGPSRRRDGTVRAADRRPTEHRHVRGWPERMGDRDDGNASTDRPAHRSPTATTT